MLCISALAKENDQDKEQRGRHHLHIDGDQETYIQYYEFSHWGDTSRTTPGTNIYNKLKFENKI